MDKKSRRGRRRRIMCRSACSEKYFGKELVVSGGG
jgi:hypothetical protein